MHLVPYRTRVVVEGRGAGTVIRVEPSRVALIFGGRSRMATPARVKVLLDSGDRAVVPYADVSLEAVAA